jgi:hypothetical protein
MSSDAGWMEIYGYGWLPSHIETVDSTESAQAVTVVTEGD